MANPGAAGLDRFKQRHAMRQGRPDCVFKNVPIDVEVVGRVAGVKLIRRIAADEMRAFRSGIDATGVDDQRAIGNAFVA